MWFMNHKFSFVQKASLNNGGKDVLFNFFSFNTQTATNNALNTMCRGIYYTREYNVHYQICITELVINKNANQTQYFAELHLENCFMHLIYWILHPALILPHALVLSNWQWKWIPRQCHWLCYWSKVNKSKRKTPLLKHNYEPFVLQ